MKHHSLVVTFFVLLLAAVVGAGGLVAAEAGETTTYDAKPDLRGTVQNTNGVPIANATVTIKGVLAGRGTVYQIHAKDCNRQAVTKADGTFLFEGVQPGTKFRIVVSAAGYQMGSFWGADPAGKSVEVKLWPEPAANDPSRIIMGRVVDADGNGIEGAEIQVGFVHTQQDWHSGGPLGYTDKQGDFGFPIESNVVAYEFTIKADGYTPRKFDEVGPGTHQFQLSRGTIITGRLVKDGKPVPNAGIGLYGIFFHNESTVTDQDGHFTFTGVAPNGEFYLFGIMQSLRELGALPRQHVKTGEEGTRIELGDLKLVEGYKISGRVQTRDGKPVRPAAFSLYRTQLTPKPNHTPTAREESNREFYGLEASFDEWRVFPDADGRFEFDGVPPETVSISLMLKPYDLLSTRNVSSDGKGFRLLGQVVSNKTNLVIEIDPHKRPVAQKGSQQASPPARDYEALSRQPLQGAEAAISR